MQIVEWEDKYNECLALLHDSHEEIKELQKARKPDVIRYHYTSQSPYLSGNSLAVQLEDSFRRNLAEQDFDHASVSLQFCFSADETISLK